MITIRYISPQPKQINHGCVSILSQSPRKQYLDQFLSKTVDSFKHSRIDHFQNVHSLSPSSKPVIKTKESSINMHQNMVNNKQTVIRFTYASEQCEESIQIEITELKIKKEELQKQYELLLLQKNENISIYRAFYNEIQIKKAQIMQRSIQRQKQIGDLKKIIAMFQQSGQ